MAGLALGAGLLAAPPFGLVLLDLDSASGDVVTEVTAEAGEAEGLAKLEVLPDRLRAINEEPNQPRLAIGLEVARSLANRDALSDAVSHDRLHLLVAGPRAGAGGVPCTHSR
jgi:hypothetical protein